MPHKMNFENLMEVFKIVAMDLEKVYEITRKSMPEGVRGRIRERLASRFFRSWLPLWCGMGMGEIIASNGESSGEVDIIIYDREFYHIFQPFTLWLGRHIYPVELVYAVIEVETYLSRERLKELAEKVLKVKKLPKTAYYKDVGAIVHTYELYGHEWDIPPTLGIIFAYDSSNLPDLKDTLIKYYDSIKAELHHYVDLICVLKKGYLAYIESNGELKRVCMPPEPNCNTIAAIEAEPYEVLAFLYITLSRILAQVRTKPIRILDYTKGWSYGHIMK